MGNVTFLLQKYIEFDQSDEEIITKAMVIGTTMFIIISIAFFFFNFDTTTGNVRLEQVVDE